MPTIISAMLIDVNSIPRIPFLSNALKNRLVQKIEEIYRARLALLIEEAGSQAALSVRIQKSPAQISQWLNGSLDSKTGKRRVMSRQIARRIELDFPKPEGWMDQPIEDVNDWPYEHFSPEQYRKFLTPEERKENEALLWGKTRAGALCRSNT